MRDILILIGESGSGKDYILKNLVRLGFNPLISTTTRPMREGEQQGVEYNFIETSSEFAKLIEQGEVLEYTTYNTKLGLWYYGLLKQSIPPRDKYKNVCIVNTRGLEQLLKSELRDRICILEIKPEHNFARLNKVCDRYGGIKNMSDKQLAEAFRREVEDGELFYNFFEWEGKDPDWRELIMGDTLEDQVFFDELEHNYDEFNEESLLDSIHFMMLSELEETI